MDYEKHYTLLCERAQNREEPEGYFERHHVVPRCLGGSDDELNIVKLTPEEHYLAHQLLVKMHPDHSGLVWAALQMTGHGNGQRSSNKVYGWLRRRYQKVAKTRKGKKNGSYGRHWYHNPDTMENIKCLPDEVPEGFIKGRRTTPYNYCKVCSKQLSKSSAQYCRKHRRSYYSKVSDEKLTKALHDHKNIRQALESVGLAAKGANYDRAKTLMGW